MSALGAIGVVGNLLGGGIEQWGAAVQSHRGRQFAREMAGTQYQRAVADMKAAGLNPMAIFGNGGGSPAGVAQGEFSNPGSAARGLGDELVKGFSQGAVNEALKAQADIARASARSAESDADLKLAENSALRAALDTDAGRMGAVNRRYGTLGTVGEVLGTFGLGNLLGGEASAKSVADHEALKSAGLNAVIGKPQKKKEYSEVEETPESLRRWGPADGRR